MDGVACKAMIAAIRSPGTALEGAERLPLYRLRGGTSAAQAGDAHEASAGLRDAFLRPVQAVWQSIFSLTARAAAAPGAHSRSRASVERSRGDE